MPKQNSKICRYKFHSTQKNHKRQSVPVIVPNQIDTTPYLNSRVSNKNSTKMWLALELNLSRKMHAASEHNGEQEKMDIEEAR